MKTYRENILEFVQKEYNISPEFLWQKFPTYAVLRNKGNKKWFAVIMQLPKEKLSLGTNGEIDVLNIKCKPEGIFQLLDEGKGFLPAYHMNKRYWISVLLDGSVRFDRIKNLIKMSYELVDSKHKKRTH